MTPSDKLTSNARNASRNTALLFAGTLTKMLGSFLFVLLCADRLGVEGFGQYSIAIHYFELFLSLSATAAGIMLTRDIARWPKRTAETMAASFALCLALCLAAPVLMFAFAGVVHAAGNAEAGKNAHKQWPNNACGHKAERFHAQPNPAGGSRHLGALPLA